LRGSGGPIPGNIKGQVGWSSEQPDLVENVPAHCRGGGPDDLLGPFQPKAFYDSMICTEGLQVMKERHLSRLFQCRMSNLAAVTKCARLISSTEVQLGNPLLQVSCVVPSTTPASFPYLHNDLNPTVFSVGVSDSVQPLLSHSAE